MAALSRAKASGIIPLDRGLPVMLMAALMGLIGLVVLIATAILLIQLLPIFPVARLNEECDAQEEKMDRRRG